MGAPAGATGAVDATPSPLMLLRFLQHFKVGDGEQMTQPGRSVTMHGTSGEHGTAASQAQMQHDLDSQVQIVFGGMQ